MEVFEYKTLTAYELSSLFRMQLEFTSLALDAWSLMLKIQSVNVKKLSLNTEQHKFLGWLKNMQFVESKCSNQSADS